MKNLLLFISLFISFPLFPQSLFTGRVTSESTGAGMEGVNVMLRDLSGPVIRAFTLTDKDGRYKLEYTGGRDSVIVFLSGFNVRTEEKRLPNRSQTVDFKTGFESVALKEIKITPPKIRQTGDTINYQVDGFVDPNDRTIGDVLKKLPGIDVKESGQILYQNKPINKFYVEDMDLLQGKYGVATNNIEAKDVSTVQVLENHQPVQALKDKVLSDQAALNLKLKDSAKGTLMGNGLLGAGADPFIWNAELTALYFGKKRQNISTYKGNNAGFDPTRELTSFYSSEAEKMGSGDLLRVQSPGAPGITQKRHLLNRAHMVSFNSLTKIDEKQLNINLDYLNNREKKGSFSRTEYYLPGSDPVRIEESLNSTRHANHANGGIQLNQNKRDYYFNNLFTFSGSWNREEGHAVGQQSVSQKLDKPVYLLGNTFDLVKNFRTTSLTVNSFNGYSSLPHTLKVRPMLYPELFGQETDSEGVQQVADQNRFLSQTKASAGFEKGRLKHDYALSFRADLRHLDSKLSPLGGPMPLVADSLQNDLQFNRFEWVFTPSYTWIHKDLRISFRIPVNYFLITADDSFRKRERNDSYLFLTPNLFLHYKLSVFTDLNANAAYSVSYSGLSSEYTGYIMTSYRNLVRNSGDFYEQKRQTYSVSMSYRNPLRSLFGNLRANYSNQKANLLYGYDYEDFIQIQRSREGRHNTDVLSLDASISQTIDAIASTVRLNGNASCHFSSRLSQGEIVRYRGESYSLAPSVTTRIRSLATLSYSLLFAENRTRIRSGEDFDPIRTLSQKANVTLHPVKNLTFTLGYEYFYNNAIASGDRTMSFGDAGIKYKWKRMEFLLDYTNVFNTKQYISASYSDISSYYYAYNLRPAEILGRVRFNLK